MSLLDMDFGMDGPRKPTAQLSPSEAQVYNQLWEKAVPGGGMSPLKGGDAAAFLSETGVSRESLRNLWQITDVEKKGSIDKEGFNVLLKLVALVQNNIEPTTANLGRPTGMPRLGSKGVQNLEITMSPDTCSSPAGSGPAWDITPADKAKYDSQFATLNPVQGKVNGATASTFFKKSNLAVAQLKRVWELSDTDKSGYLDSDEFAVGMHLIIRLKGGSPLPAALSPSLIPPSKRSGTSMNVSRQTSTISNMSNNASLGSGMTQSGTSRQTSIISSGGEEWVVNPIERAQFHETFKTIGSTNAQGQMVANGAKCRDVFSRSNLAKEELGQIWRLCDFEKKGELDNDQFALALHLIHNKRKGEAIPTQLQTADIPPSWRGRYQPSGISSTAPSMPAPRQGAQGPAQNSGPPAIPRRTLPPGFVPPLPVDQMTVELVELGNTKKALELELATRTSEAGENEAKLRPLENQLKQIQQEYQMANTEKQKATLQLQDMQRKGQEYQRTLQEMQKRLGQEDSAIQELRNQIGNQAGNMQVLKGEYDRITGGVSGLQERHKNLSGEVEANIREMQTMAAMTNEINSQIADLKKQLVEEELAVEKDVKKLEASGNTTNLPFGVGIRSTVAHSISSAPTYVREDPAIKPPKPLKEMTEQEQVDWAMKMTEKEMTPEEREEAELRQALEASLRD